LGIFTQFIDNQYGKNTSSSFKVRKNEKARWKYRKNTSTKPLILTLSVRLFDDYTQIACV